MARTKFPAAKGASGERVKHDATKRIRAAISLLMARYVQYRGRNEFKLATV